MDAETIRAIAQTSAQEAASELAQHLREELRENMAQFRYEMREEIRNEFQTHFGELKASDHIIQHDRIERLLKLVDKLSTNVIGKLLANLILVLVAAGAVGYVLWAKLTGGM